MSKYEIELEISGPTAMWTRPDTGATPVSYPVPPWSAAKGIFESVVRLKNTFINPTAVEICSPIIHHDYTTNYGGPLRKGEQITKGDSFQHKATVLINVCYRLYANIEDFAYIPKNLSEAAELADLKFNSKHYCKDLFNRRLKKGRFHDTPCLGWREFMPDYIGRFRDSTIIEQSINEQMQSFLYCVFDPVSEICNPRYVQNPDGRRIKEGRLEYVE
jgi:CRISPR-associated protein Cas5d